MANIRIKSEDILPDTKYTLKKINYDVQKKDGSWAHEEREVYHHGNAVTALLYNKEQRTVILTKQFRLPTYINGNTGGMLVETCAGLLEEGEEPQKAVIREIEEETGYAVTEMQKVFEAYSSAGIITELIYYYLAEYRRDQRKDKGGGLEEEGEEIQVIELSFDAAFQMLDKGEIKDAKTIILLQYLKLKGI